MKVKFINPSSLGWTETRLDQETMDFLWDAINESQKTKKSIKGGLVGNIQNSYILKDKNNWFTENILKNHANLSYKASGNKFPIQHWHTEGENIPKDEKEESFAQVSNPFSYTIRDWWVNYQYKHEFNPTHYHSGLYSFVIWMKVPYNFKDEHSLPFLKGIKDQDKRAGMFSFTTIDMLGDSSSYVYEPREGTMLFFPSKLHHEVYPFYTSDDARISIAGNLTLDLDIS